MILRVERSTALNAAVTFKRYGGSSPRWETAETGFVPLMNLAACSVQVAASTDRSCAGLTRTLPHTAVALRLLSVYGGVWRPQHCQAS